MLGMKTATRMFGNWHRRVLRRFDCQGGVAEVDTYCMFIGYPRSGHSLVGSLLDAHPNIVIAHELDALKCIEMGWDRSRIWEAIVEKSRVFAKHGRTFQEFSYRVAGQWHGNCGELKVIGDKKGGKSTMRLAQNPRLLEQLRETMRVQQKFIHVIRNPYDNVATMARRSGESLEQSMQTYFSLCETVTEVRSRVARDDWIDLRHEALIADPRGQLAALCAFLGQDCSPDYLESCASIVYEAPHRSRHRAQWTPQLIRDLATRMQAYSFLSGYRFDE